MRKAILELAVTRMVAGCGGGPIDTPQPPPRTAPKTTAAPASKAPAPKAVGVCEVVTADEVGKVFAATVAAEVNTKSFNKGCDYKAGGKVVMKTNLLSVSTSMFASPQAVITGTAAGMKQEPVAGLGDAAAYLVDATLSDKLIIIKKGGKNYVQFQLWTLDDKQPGNKDKLIELGKAAVDRM